jgi:hypothetical protein
MGCGGSKETVQFDFGDSNHKSDHGAANSTSTPVPTPFTRPAETRVIPPTNNKPQVVPAPVHQIPTHKPSETFRPPVASTSFTIAEVVTQQPQAIQGVVAAIVPKAAAAAPSLSNHLASASIDITYQNDDGDFSVAPSLALDCRSISKTSFKDIYMQGKKVRSIIYSYTYYCI